MSYEQLSPVQIEQKLRECVTDLTKAEKALRECRDAETDAELAYRRAYREYLLSDECPRATRAGVTVAERDAWVEQRCAAEFEAHRMAHTRCKSAEDHVRRVRDVTTAVQTIASLTKAALSLAGHS